MRRYAGMVSASWRTAGKVNGRHAVILRGTGRTDWFVAIRRYLVAMAVGNLVWETAQLPLYTLWRTGTPAQVAAAVVHCTVGDIAIAIVMLVVALALFGTPAWPDEKFPPVLMAALAGGIGYTIYSEYVNTGPRASWAYDRMDADPALDRHGSFAARAMDRGAITRISFCAARCVPLATQLKTIEELRP